jgi:hypothetical protein
MKKNSLSKRVFYWISGFVMWGVLYITFNTHNGVFTHSVWSGGILAFSVLILNGLATEIVWSNLLRSKRDNTKAKA